jgi:hypothetical protein
VADQTLTSEMIRFDVRLEFPHVFRGYSMAGPTRLEPATSGLSAVEEGRLVLFDEEAYRAFEQALKETARD